METLAENWFFVLILLFCIGVHFFGHGHGHGKPHGSRPGNEDGHSADSAGPKQQSANFPK